MTVAVGLFVLGLPFALAWGVMAAVLRFIPYVGAWMAAASPRPPEPRGLRRLDQAAARRRAVRGDGGDHRVRARAAALRAQRGRLVDRPTDRRRVLELALGTDRAGRRDPPHRVAGGVLAHGQGPRVRRHPGRRGSRPRSARHLLSAPPGRRRSGGGRAGARDGRRRPPTCEPPTIHPGAGPGACAAGSGDRAAHRRKSSAASSTWSAASASTRAAQHPASRPRRKQRGGRRPRARHLHRRLSRARRRRRTRALHAGAPARAHRVRDAHHPRRRSGRRGDGPPRDLPARPRLRGLRGGARSHAPPRQAAAHEPA